MRLRMIDAFGQPASARRHTEPALGLFCGAQTSVLGSNAILCCVAFNHGRGGIAEAERRIPGYHSSLIHRCRRPFMRCSCSRTPAKKKMTTMMTEQEVRRNASRPGHIPSRRFPKIIVLAGLLESKYAGPSGRNGRIASTLTTAHAAASSSAASSSGA
jgi:hypothetical protein